MSEKETEIIIPKEKEKTKNPKRVAAGKRGAEAKKMKSELRRKETELLKKENIELKVPKQITKDDDDVDDTLPKHIYKNYIPLCLIGAVGLGLYMYKSKQVTPMIQKQPMIHGVKKEIDSFEFI